MIAKHVGRCVYEFFSIFIVAIGFGSILGHNRVDYYASSWKNYYVGFSDFVSCGIFDGSNFLLLISIC